jgi:hypothetical protein
MKAYRLSIWNRPTRHALAGLAGILLLAGCTPQFDWREVRNEQPGWVATFPGKPVEVARTLTLPGIANPVTLTIRSARIKDSMFAVGWAVNTDNTPGADERLRKILEAAMLNNLQHDPATTQRTVVKIGDRPAQQVVATGSIKAGEKGAADPAGLWMRSLVISAPSIPLVPTIPAAPAASSLKPASTVIEIIAVGPASFLTEDQAMQFLQSFRLP